MSAPLPPLTEVLVNVFEVTFAPEADVGESVRATHAAVRAAVAAEFGAEPRVLYNTALFDGRPGRPLDTATMLSTHRSKPRRAHALVIASETARILGWNVAGAKISRHADATSARTMTLFTFSWHDARDARIQEIVQSLVAPRAEKCVHVARIIIM
jgi:hypothetical protein